MSDNTLILVAKAIKELKVDYLVDMANYQTNPKEPVVNVLDALEKRIVSKLDPENAVEFKKVIK